MGLNRSEAARLVGKQSGVIKAVDKVSKSDIRHWCEVLGDPDPEYTERIRQGKKAAPPTMTMVWAMPALWPPGSAVEPHEKLLRMLDEAGYSGTAGIALDQEFLRPARIGDRLSYRVKVAGLSKGETATRMGRGYVVDLHYTFLDGRRQAVSKQRYKILKFQKVELSS